jgi:hypothetical protein
MRSANIGMLRQLIFSQPSRALCIMETSIRCICLPAAIRRSGRKFCILRINLRSSYIITLIISLYKGARSLLTARKPKRSTQVSTVREESNGEESKRNPTPLHRCISIVNVPLILRSGSTCTCLRGSAVSRMSILRIRFVPCRVDGASGLELVKVDMTPTLNFNHLLRFYNGSFV